MCYIYIIYICIYTYTYIYVYTYATYLYTYIYIHVKVCTHTERLHVLKLVRVVGSQERRNTHLYECRFLQTCIFPRINILYAQTGAILVDFAYDVTYILYTHICIHTYAHTHTHITYVQARS